MKNLQITLISLHISQAVMYLKDVTPNPPLWRSRRRSVREPKMETPVTSVNQILNANCFIDNEALIS